MTAITPIRVSLTHCSDRFTTSTVNDVDITAALLRAFSHMSPEHVEEEVESGDDHDTLSEALAGDPSLLDSEGETCHWNVVGYDLRFLLHTSLGWGGNPDDCSVRTLWTEWLPLAANSGAEARELERQVEAGQKALRTVLLNHDALKTPQGLAAFCDVLLDQKGSVAAFLDVLTRRDDLNPVEVLRTLACAAGPSHSISEQGREQSP